MSMLGRITKKDYKNLSMDLCLKNNEAFSAAVEVVQLLQAHGYVAYLAGGCVRDLLLGRVPRDFDVATSAPPHVIQTLFPNVIETGTAFSVFRVVQGEIATEVACFRKDIGTLDGRHPMAVEPATPEEDAQRRDFTINALFYDPVQRKLLDFVGGQNDLRARLIRTVGIPKQRFEEDYLRMLRAVRFAAVLDFEIDPSTFAAIRESASQMAKISAERIQYELTVLLTEAKRAGYGVRLLRESQLLAIILPEIDALAGVPQPPASHPEGDVFEHTVRMLDLMTFPRTLELAYAVLFHDAGKAPCIQWKQAENGQVTLTFPEHARVGAELAEQALRRLRFPNKVIEVVAHCVRNHMRIAEAQRMRLSKLKALVAAPTFPLELELHRLDCLASHGDLSNYEFLVEFLNKQKQEPKLPKPWITGRDIMKLGVPEGPAVGHWKKLAYEAQLENQFPDREALLDWLKKAVKESVK